MTDQNLIDLYYLTTDLWSDFCEQHADLFDKTCEEYQCLLGNKIDELDEVVREKEQIVANIKQLEDKRQSVIWHINQVLDEEYRIEKASELLMFLEPVGKDLNQNHLFQFNRILIDIIEKIQNQNKKNQIFLNKAIDSIEKLRHEVAGNKTYNSYDNKGKLKNVGGRI